MPAVEIREAVAADLRGVGRALGEEMLEGARRSGFRAVQFNTAFSERTQLAADGGRRPHRK